MKLLRSSIIAVFAGLAFAVAAWAIQPGTTGTNKANQESGFRTGVLLQKNNTATAAANAATLNAAGSGVITSEALTTLTGSSYTLTLTSNMIAAADIVLWSVNNGTNTGGDIFPKTVTPAAGSAVFVVQNNSGSTSLNGTIQVRYLVVKQNANGSD